MSRPGRRDEISWGDEECCFDVFPRAIVATLFAMLANLPAMLHYIRTGEEPK